MRRMAYSIRPMTQPTIDGKAAIAGSRIEGEVVLNGRRLGRGRA